MSSVPRLSKARPYSRCLPIHFYYCSFNSWGQRWNLEFWFWHALNLRILQRYQRKANVDPYIWEFGFKKFGLCCGSSKKPCVCFFGNRLTLRPPIGLHASWMSCLLFSLQSLVVIGRESVHGCKDLAFPVSAPTSYRRVNHGTHLLDPLPHFWLGSIKPSC